MFIKQKQKMIMIKPAKKIHEYNFLNIQKYNVFRKYIIELKNKEICCRESVTRSK